MVEFIKTWYVKLRDRNLHNNKISIIYIIIKSQTSKQVKVSTKFDYEYVRSSTTKYMIVRSSMSTYGSFIKHVYGPSAFGKLRVCSSMKTVKHKHVLTTYDRGRSSTSTSTFQYVNT